MRWKTKALTQRLVALLPSSVSYATYYWLQSTFGQLKTANPEYALFVGAEAWKRLKAHGLAPAGKTFLEVGTGRAPLVPLAFYLMGAKSTITIDLNPYLRPEMVAAALQHFVDNPEKARAVLGEFLDERRWAELAQFQRRQRFDLSSFLDLCNIQYIAPGDAARIGLPAGSIDFHTSNTALEHIPRDIMLDILKEGDRILRQDGLFIHRIDYSDHFAHSDRSIPLINFLQYTDQEWDRYANNRYMYMNRLRHDDLLEIFGANGRHIVGDEPDVNQDLLAALNDGTFRVAQKFAGKSAATLATTGAWIMARKGLTS